MAVVLGDITRCQVDAIVNAANTALLGGGGVDGAIHAAAGPELLEACRRLPEVAPGVRCPTGEARLTPGYRLPAQFVIHTVGPVWQGGQGGEPELLASAYRSALALASQQGLRSVAFPAISTGIFGYPLELACGVAVSSVAAALAQPGTPEQVLFVAFSERVRAALERELEHEQTRLAPARPDS
jgi:O-acetyl-ADP-ribose deacetylase (regulator of RNase III)